MNNPELEQLFPSNTYEEAAVRLQAIEEAKQYYPPGAGVSDEQSDRAQAKLARQDHFDGPYLGVDMAYVGDRRDAIKLHIEYKDPESDALYVKKYVATSEGDVLVRPEEGEPEEYATLSDEEANEIHSIVSNTIVLSLCDRDQSSDSLFT